MLTMSVGETAASTTRSDGMIDNHEGHINNENSPESAGLARGLARSAAPRGASNLAVGRLPLSRTGPSSIVSKTSSVARATKSSSGRMARIQRVAKVSDRASTGFDFVDAHQQSLTATETHKSPNVNDGWKIRISNFARSLVKNTLLGAAVFATYEESIDHFETIFEEKISATSDSMNGKSNDQRNPADYNYSSTQLSHHYAAGFGAGCVHAFLGSLFEGLSRVTKWQPRNGLLSSSWPQISGAAFLPHLLHHATSHAVLFGSYETTKRALNHALARTPTSSQITGISHHESEFLDQNLVTVALAGGIAGIGQQLVGDSSEQLAKALQTKRPSTIQGWMETLKPPSYSSRSLGLVSIPTAIGFVAFEYGREAVLPD